MTKEEIFVKQQTEVTIRGLNSGIYYSYNRSIDLFLIWSDQPYEELTAFPKIHIMFDRKKTYAAKLQKTFCLPPGMRCTALLMTANS